MVDLDSYLMVAKLRDRLQSRKGKSLFFARISDCVREKTGMTLCAIRRKYTRKEREGVNLRILGQRCNVLKFNAPSSME